MNIDNEIQAVRNIILANYSDLIYITVDQFAFNGLVTKCLQDKSDANRIRVLQVLLGDVPERITGVPFKSTKNLTSPIAKFFIEYFRDETQEKWMPNEYARELLGGIEARLERLPQADPV